VFQPCEIEKEGKVERMSLEKIQRLPQNSKETRRGLRKTKS